MEGYQRRRVAEDKIKNDILPIADAVIALPSDLLFCSMEAETPIHEAHVRANTEMARALMALASILGGANLFSADFASFTGVLKRRHTLCSLGTAMIDDGDNAAAGLMNEMLISPLLGGPDNLDHADAVAFSLLGGPELSIGTARAVLDLCSRHVNPEMDKKVLLGASTSETFAGKLQLTALAVRYLDAVIPVAESVPRRQFHRDSSRDVPEIDGEQLALPNLEVEEKGIMENTSPVMINGEDLDVPTYRRRGLVIDAGK
jgi:cell division protein FtsZ